MDPTLFPFLGMDPYMLGQDGLMPVPAPEGSMAVPGMVPPGSSAPLAPQAPARPAPPTYPSWLSAPFLGAGTTPGAVPFATPPITPTAAPVVASDDRGISLEGSGLPREGSVDDPTRRAATPNARGITDSLRGLTAAARPEVQKVGTPAAPRPAAVPATSQLLALLMAMGGGGEGGAASGMRLPSTLGAALNAGGR